MCLWTPTSAVTVILIARSMSVYSINVIQIAAELHGTYPRLPRELLLRIAMVGPPEAFLEGASMFLWSCSSAIPQH